MTNENEPPRISGLENLSLAKLRDPVSSYRNLFYHRTVVVEGIRKIAFRNMAHLTDAIGRPPSLDAFQGDDWVTEVQRRMLHDQGMDDTPLDRILIGWATYLPLQVYLALLYAEVEFYRDFCEANPLLDDSRFSAFLQNREEFVDKLGEFRGFFLHPSRENAPSELGFLSVSGSYNLAPELQSNVDQYLDRTRERLSDVLRGMLSGLPEVQKLYCLSEFLPKNHARMTVHRDPKGQEHVVGQMEKLTERLAEIGESAASWSPSYHQEVKASILATYLNELSPSAPEQVHTDLIPSQTPMSTLTLLSLTAGLAPRSYGSGRYALHVQGNIGEIRRVIIAAGVLQNELITGLGRFTPERLKELASSMSECDFAKHLYGDLLSGGLQHADERVALGRVSAALLYEPLRLYSEVVKSAPGVSRSGLDELTATTALAALAVHRNSVFHICKPHQEPAQADLATASPSLLELVSRLHPELSAFFGITAQELSNLL